MGETSYVGKKKSVLGPFFIDRNRTTITEEYQDLSGKQIILLNHVLKLKK